MVLAGPGSLKVPGKNPPLLLLALGCCWQSSALLVCAIITPPFLASDFTWSSSLHLHWSLHCLLCPYKEAGHQPLGLFRNPYPNPIWPHLNLITSAKILFPIKATFTGTGGKDFNFFLREHNPTHNRGGGHQVLERASSLRETAYEKL